MKPIHSGVIKLLLLGLMVLTITPTLHATPPLRAQQLHGQAARDFLAQSGILSRLQIETTRVSAPEAEASSGNGTSWRQQQKVVAGEYFGWSVALDRETALIGAPGANVEGKQLQGAAYVYIRTGSGWVQQQKLVASDGAADDGFGHSVALAGETALVGATEADVGKNENQGAVYVFTRSGTNWSEQQKLVAPNGAAYDWFGNAVALAGATALVGAVFADVEGSWNQGAAYVFTRSGTNWSEQQKLVASDGTAADNFGSAVALEEGTALVGAHEAAVEGKEGQGAAYVFARSGIIWSQQQKLVASDRGSDERFRFGNSVALSGETALVGADFADEEQGAVYVFTRSGTTWSQHQKLVASDGASDDLFGRSIALAGEMALVGAEGAKVGMNHEQGAVYVFTRSGTIWSQQQKLVASDGALGDFFGVSVALSGEISLVGTPTPGAVIFFEQQLPFKRWLPLAFR